jgi:MPBQ/MSBQ methyltransferase
MRISTLFGNQETLATRTQEPSHQQRIINYYTSATAGYKDWSPQVNMHFGCYEWGMNPLDLEAMLQRTNYRVYQALGLTGTDNHLLDMGCGLGATARHCLDQPSVEQVTAITLCGNQIKEAQAIEYDLAENKDLIFEQADYHNTHYADTTFDGVYAIESACHSVEADKRSLIKEAHRLLKPGAKLVICDALLKQPEKMNALSKLCYRKTCENWALGQFGDIDQVKQALEEEGFTDIQFDNITLRVLPSAAFVPWVCLRYLSKLILTNDTNPDHWAHLYAPLWGFALGFNLRRFGYYVVSARKG